LHEVSALAVGGTAKIRTGDTVLMLKVVGVVKASVRRDGRIQAQGSPADYARLGVVEERLDRAAGPGSIACRTPDRSASSRWESPQATRASRYCSVSPVRLELA
jgi:hypothetical protein